MAVSAESASGAGAAAGRVPDFFIVGHHKSGTTALYEMLSRHAGVFMSDIKEPRWFASDLRPRFAPPPGRARELPQSYAEYLELFAPARAEQRVGEATPAYLFSHEAAANIAAAAPAARIVALLREPASFLRSLHLQLLRSHVESEKDLRSALALESQRREGSQLPARSHLPQLLQYSEHVRYVEQLRRYEAVFAPEQILVLLYDDFRADNEGTLRRVLEFLEVAEEAAVGEVDVKRTTRTIRSQRLDDALVWATMDDSALARRARATIKALAPRGLRRGAFRTVRRRGVYAEAPAPDERLMAELRERFRPEVAALGEHLGRDLLAQWGYDASA